MTTPVRSHSDDIQSKTARTEFAVLLNLAEAMGCQLQPTAEHPTTLRGLCPFHESSTMTNAKTLTVDVRHARFHCQYCKQRGNAVAFAAIIWGVCANDAQLLLDSGAELVPDRPPYPPTLENPEPRNGRRQPRPQNTAILTRAARHYSNELNNSRLAREAVVFLTQLGVDIDEAANAGIGYSSGTTLRRALEAMDLFAGELEESPLFNANGTERFAGQIVMADRDFTGGVLWMTSITPRGPQGHAGWPVRRPRTRGIMGRRPYLFGTYSVPNQAPLAVLTDDPRVYIVLATQQIPTFLTVDRDDAAIIGRMVARRQPRRLAIAMHNRQLRLQIARRLVEELPRLQFTLLNREYILSLLTPATRDLSKITDFEPEELPPLSADQVGAIGPEPREIEEPMKTAEIPYQSDQDDAEAADSDQDEEAAENELEPAVIQDVEPDAELDARIMLESFSEQRKPSISNTGSYSDFHES